MTIIATSVAPPDALVALGSAIAEAKQGDPLAPVLVAVPTNTCGVMARRALGRSVGVAGVDFVTLNRLAELIAGPGLATAERSPMSTPVIDLAIGNVLRRDPGPFRPVAAHPSTTVALRELHQELRLAGPEAAARLSAHSARGRQCVRISDAVTAALSDRWYDEADLLTHAIEAVGRAGVGGLRSVVLHLPQELPELALDFVRALGSALTVQVVVQVTGERGPDEDASALLAALDVTDSTEPVGNGTPEPAPVSITSTTDADDEVRVAVRRVVDAARNGTPLERMAILWPAQRPYARLVEHHLTAAGIAWNGRPGTTTSERLAPRLVLDLLDVDRRGLRRRSLFELLADVPARDADGTYLPTAEWERASREAGVARDEDWNRRLAALATIERWSDSATSLQAFVDDLRQHLGHPSATRRWWDWAQWCTEQLDRWLGRYSLERLPDAEYRAWESLTRALDRLRHLDPVGEPVTRHRFRATLEAELEATPGRHGRVGDGVTVGPLAGSVGIDVDVAIILGAAEGLLPPTPTSDPLLSEADREVAGLATTDARAMRLHRLMLAVLGTSDVTFTVPRGDLRATSLLQPSRWIGDWAGGATQVEIDSHHAGLQSTEFPVSDSEFRLRRRYTQVRSGGELLETGGADDDTALQRGVACTAARASDLLTIYDGDLSGASVPRLAGPASPSRLEQWVACPHAYFLRYLLRVRPIDEPGDGIGISAPDRGSAHHQALDRFHKAVIAGELPQPTTAGWGPEHRAALGAYFDEVCERTEGRGRTGRPAVWADERERMRADLFGWLDHDSEVVAARGSVVLASEYRFGGDSVGIGLLDGRTLSIEGSIDRVDRISDGSLVVTDHKTGANNFKKLTAEDPTMGATLFQLPSYAAAARAMVGGEPPVRAEYGLFGRGEYDRPGVLLTADVDERVAAALTTVVDGIEHGFFPNRPDRPGWRMRVNCYYCEPDGLGTTERWAEWERKHHDPRLQRWFGDPVDDDADGGGASRTESER